MKIRIPPKLYIIWKIHCLIRLYLFSGLKRFQGFGFIVFFLRLLFIIRSGLLSCLSAIGCIRIACLFIRAVVINQDKPVWLSHGFSAGSVG